MLHTLLVMLADGGIQVEWGPWHGLAFLALVFGGIYGAIRLGRRLGGNVERNFDEPPPPSQP